MIVSVEFLYHFSCPACENWWSVGDFQWAPNKEITCPHCRHTEVIPDAVLAVGDDVSGSTTNLFEDVEKSRQAFKLWRQQRRAAANAESSSHSNS